MGGQERFKGVTDSLQYHLTADAKFHFNRSAKRTPGAIW